MPYNSPHYSRSRWSGWSGLSLSLVGSLVVFAVAALSGAVIGGVSIYLINDAATPPPSAGANTNPATVLGDGATTSPSAGQQAAQQASGPTNGRPVRVIDPAFPPPSSAESKPVAPAATETAIQPAAENSASSAAIQAQPTTSQPPAVAQPQTPPASAATSQPIPQDNAQTVTPGTATNEAVTHDAAAQAAAPETGDHAGLPRKAVATRKRATNARRLGVQSDSQASDQAQSTRRNVYDYYDRDRDNDEQRASATGPDTTMRGRPDSRDPRARRGVSQTQQRVIGRRQDNYDRDARDGDADRHGFPAQPRPAQSFFGLFGGDHHSDDGRD